jgi:hypothetical protein
MQSAYRTGHSTETALLRVHHDITYALDNNACVILLMLDLHTMFLTDVTNRLGKHGIKSRTKHESLWNAMFQDVYEYVKVEPR